MLFPLAIIFIINIIIFRYLQSAQRLFLVLWIPEGNKLNSLLPTASGSAVVILSYMKKNIFCALIYSSASTALPEQKEKEKQLGVNTIMFLTVKSNQNHVKIKKYIPKRTKILLDVNKGALGIKRV